jgi:glycosyltransferase involved in cell wall biosynthesis
MFPLLLFIKLLKIKLIYWGHGIDLLDKKAYWLKRYAYIFEHSISDAIILYAPHLQKNISRNFNKKTFVANNTLYFDNYKIENLNKNQVLSRYGIDTKTNIICMGRMQKRKRIDNLFEAFSLLKRDDIGLIFVGPDDEKILKDLSGNNIYKLPPIYDSKRLELLSAADIFCIPGAIGLGIVDAFYCGVPIVTEEGDMSPEIMYLKDGINCYIVPRNNIQMLAKKLQVLADNIELRMNFSQAAKHEVMTNGHIDKMCEGFLKALQYVWK